MAVILIAIKVYSHFNEKLSDIMKDIKYLYSVMTFKVHRLIY